MLFTKTLNSTFKHISGCYVPIIVKNAIGKREVNIIKDGIYP